VKIDFDDLYFYPISKQMAFDHQRAVKDTPNLGDFLDWGHSAVTWWNLRDHQKWVNLQSKYPAPYSANAIYWKQQFVGMFVVTKGADKYGAQFLYWVRGNFQGNGIATVITEIFMTKIFSVRDFDYIEIHIDQQNLASQAVPKKLGFEIEDSYRMDRPMGSKGSGMLDVWVKYQPNLVKYRPELVKNKPRSFGWGKALMLEDSTPPIFEEHFADLQHLD